jgi:hypothetical protein
MFSLSVGLKESNKVNCLQWWRLWNYHLPERSFRGRELLLNRILPMWLIGCRVSWIDHCLFNFASRFSSALVSVKSSHVPREGNFMADALAKQGVKRICELVAWLWYLILPRLFESICDLNGNLVSLTSSKFRSTNSFFQIKFVLLWLSWKLCGYSLCHAGAWIVMPLYKSVGYKSHGWLKNW